MKRSVAILTRALALPWQAATQSRSPGVPPLSMDEMADVVDGSFAPWNAGTETTRRMTDYTITDTDLDGGSVNFTFGSLAVNQVDLRGTAVWRWVH